MHTTTWVDRITDESDPWLLAVESERHGYFAEAAVRYLDDSTRELGLGHLAKAGLSASCAADCLGRIGLPEQANSILTETAFIYRQNAELASGSSIREALWSLRMSRRSFALAGDENMAEEVQRRYEVMARRVDPLALGRAGERFDDVRAPSPKGETVARGQTFPALLAAIDAFMNARRTARPRPGRNGKPTGTRGAPTRSENNEKSIVNQLG